MTAELRAAVVEGAGRAFVNGLHAAVVVTGVLCVLGAVVAGAGIRSRVPAEEQAAAAEAAAR
ncbi:hypothetical protein M2169_001372 [Streptomyces sp. MJP52]|nr:hypothetical protein [Streptomyces sp. MJP52]